MTVTKDELKDAVGAAVATALFEHNRIMERHDQAAAQNSFPINVKNLVASILAATLLGLTGWVFTTSNRVSLLENNMERLSADVKSVNTNVGKILDSVRIIENSRFTSSDWETRAAPLVNRLKLVEDGETEQWKNIRVNEVATEKLKYDVQSIKDTLNKWERKQ